MVSTEKKMLGHTNVFFNWTGSDISRLIGLSVLYAVSSFGALIFLVSPEGVAAIWPASGVFLSALLLSPTSQWWVIGGIFVLIDLTFEVIFGRLSLVVAVVYSLSLAAQAIVSAVLLQHFVKQQLTFNRLNEVITFLLLGCTLPVVVLAVPPAIVSYALLDGNALQIWWWWSISSGIGVLLVCPLILSCYQGLVAEIKQMSQFHRIELITFLISVFLVTRYIYITDNPPGAPLAPYSYLIFPPLIWGAMRFRANIMSLAFFILVSVAIYYDYQSGYFSGNTVFAFESVLALQMFLLIIIGVMFLLTALSTERSQYEKLTKRSLNELRLLASKIQSSRENERISIARHVHDELGQSLIALRFDLVSIMENLPKTMGSQLAQVQSMIALTDSIQDSMRKLAHNLRPPILDDLGLVSALEWYLQESAKRTDYKYEFVAQDKNIVLDTENSTALFRIFQETITNITRHAMASFVEVALHKVESGLELVVKDNGIGINEQDKISSKSLGLIGMRERAMGIGGVVAINRANDHGTIVTITIPLAGSVE